MFGAEVNTAELKIAQLGHKVFVDQPVEKLVELCAFGDMGFSDRDGYTFNVCAAHEYGGERIAPEVAGAM